MPDCLFCGQPIEDWGLGWYAHVEQDGICWDLWHDWTVKVKQDRPGG